MIKEFSTLLSEVGCNIERLDTYIKKKVNGQGAVNFHLHIDAGADREFTEQEILKMKSKIDEIKKHYELQRCEIGVLRHKRVDLQRVDLLGEVNKP
jgi:hypothetical protein